jgi:hypothetical protein
MGFLSFSNKKKTPGKNLPFFSGIVDRCAPGGSGNQVYWFASRLPRLIRVEASNTAGRVP